VTLDDPAAVRAQYADETRLAARKRAHARGEGPDAREVLFQAVARARPRRVLEVGCGEGELAERMVRELGVDLVAVDQSERMVELTRARGIDARVGDVQDLDFPDAAFDCAVAAWMLFHVANLERALGELARVLRPGGRLVATTNSPDHLRELDQLLDDEPFQARFNSANGESMLLKHFSLVERTDAHGWVVFPDRAAAQEYVDSLIRYSGQRLPEFDGPLRARRTPSVFVAEK
jgi:SAM-dependent methyltransferase